MINYYRASVRQSQKEAAAKLRPISAPTLVIWGERDSYLGPELAEPDRDDVPNLDRVERLADASHWCITTRLSESPNCSSTSSPRRPASAYCGGRRHIARGRTIRTKAVQVTLGPVSRATRASEARRRRRPPFPRVVAYRPDGPLDGPPELENPGGSSAGSSPAAPTSSPPPEGVGPLGVPPSSRSHSAVPAN